MSDSPDPRIEGRPDPLTAILRRRDRLVALCEEYGVRRLALFGSALRPDFTEESDLDLLVEFHTGVRTGLRLFELEARLSELLGRTVDLNTPGFLSRAFRPEVQAQARDIYVAA